MQFEAYPAKHGPDQLPTMPAAGFAVKIDLRLGAADAN
jgi:hypothetical protein